MDPRHCARCGAALSAFDDHGHRRLRCPSCGRVAYVNSKPAVGAIVPREGMVLLSKRAREPHRGAWDLPGGFLEAGEHPEAGIVRELREETGCAARVVRLVHVGMGEYVGESTLNLIYECCLEGEPRPLDDAEAFQWFPVDEAPRLVFPHEQAALDAWRHP